MASLGAVIISENPKELEDTILYLRNLGIIDEISVVADVKDNTEVYDVAQKYADNYTCKKTVFPEDALDQVISMATTDWIFRIDDDERMENNFITDVKPLIESDLFDVYWLPRKWLWPDKNHYLAQFPWYPDHQIRLFKKGFVKAPNAVHTHASGSGRSGIAEHFHILHYNLVDKSYDFRMSRSERYAKMMNITTEEFLRRLGIFYFPENWLELEIKEL